jgi:hypothetical protein
MLVSHDPKDRASLSYLERGYNREIPEQETG